MNYEYTTFPEIPKDSASFSKDIDSGALAAGETIIAEPLDRAQGTPMTFEWNDHTYHEDSMLWGWLIAILSLLLILVFVYMSGIAQHYSQSISWRGLNLSADKIIEELEGFTLPEKKDKSVSSLNEEV